MKRKKPRKITLMFDAFAASVTHISGQPFTFFAAILIILIWVITGPLFGFSDTWQLVINTGTTVITFLMVFVIQQSQNKDSLAVQLKLNELIAATKTASNRLISIEDLTEEELEVLKKFYSHLSKIAKDNKDIFSTHSIDEAKLIDSLKREGRKKKE
ncbi:MAG TPA: low affinity iron permease family protein [Chitinophagales bacterium]|nr:low affinity iron permease family protein [Chitinophagales bacterium]